ncbi:MAG: class I SAM-dependent methyltransferase [Acidimicrobiia bacterium]
MSRGAPIDYDAELRLHYERLRQAFEIGETDRVLDIGCGAGQTTRDAARSARAGSAHGVDTSALMIQRARHLSRVQGIVNVTYQHADAETCQFPMEPFDIAISRFGTMFFANPVAAFANIGRALKPSASLVMMVWQAHEQNEWSTSIEHALVGATPPPRATPGHFSLADPNSVNRILGSAGFSEADFKEVHEPVFYGQDVAAALDFVTGFQDTKEMLQRLEPASAEAATERLRQTLAAHQANDGVWLDSRSWIITAQRQ